MKYLVFPVLLLLCCACGNEETEESAATDTQVANAPRFISYSVLQTYPHDTSSFTQGLLVYKGDLYEGTGLEGKSKLMKVDMKTGKATQQTSLDPSYFGEGVTILNDTVYQLTWQNRVVCVYTLKDFKKIKELRIGTEGWGLTTDGKDLIASDGSGKLYFYEPSTFRLLRSINVTEGGSASYNLNELEYINGFVYANQYQSPFILKINPADGAISGKIDLTNMWNQVVAIAPEADVPNGIAYDELTKKIYITGKLWPHLYEVQLAD